MALPSSPPNAQLLPFRNFPLEIPDDLSKGYYTALVIGSHLQCIASLKVTRRISMHVVIAEPPQKKRLPQKMEAVSAMQDWQCGRAAVPPGHL